MEGTKLIMLEGLPGTGKTTNSAFIRMQLERNGKETKWIHEVARPHPMLFFSEASLTHDEYDSLKKTFPHAASALDSIAVIRENTVGIDLLETEWSYANTIGDSVFNALKKFDTWNFSLEKYIELALEKWADFSENALLDKDTVYILDSSIFQYQIFRFMFKKAPYEKLEKFISKLVDIVKPLNPSLIYLFRDNPEATIDFFEKERGKNVWDSIWKRDKEEPYYQDKPQGAEGVKQFFRDYAHYAKSLFNSVECNKIAIEISQADWPRYENEMLAFLRIKNISSPSFFPQNGTYINNTLNFKIIVDGLTIKDPTGKIRKLIPKSESEFYVECLPVILRFKSQKNIIITGLQISERWTTTGTTYAKL